ncbi:unnamed protein product [Dicrocoelium dendriticum]|nr:unnamed protein product [Dicrocoelium dendriticum]
MTFSSHFSLKRCHFFVLVVLIFSYVFHFSGDVVYGQSTPPSNFQDSTLALLSNSSNGTSNTPPSHTEAILYGLLATTVTNLAAAFGVVFVPLHKYRFYPIFISFMVAIAVGSLFSTAVLVLLPEALRLGEFSKHDLDLQSGWYIPTSLSVCGGSFLFFILEFMLRRIRVRSTFAPHSTLISLRDSLDSHTNTPVTVSRTYGPKELERDISKHGDADYAIASSMLTSNGSVTVRSSQWSNEKTTAERGSSPLPMSSPSTHNQEHCAAPIRPTEKLTLCTPNLCARMGTLDPVVWMIVVGDGVHNFMDGLSLGAGFITDLRLGLSLTLSILCEELPHELGDFAIFLRSGLAVSLAVILNLVSASMAYLGFFLGIILGEMPDASTYIFGVTAGFFLYISLADMLPEMQAAEEERERKNASIIPLFFAHCCGLMIGFGCILTITLLADRIAI